MVGVEAGGAAGFVEVAKNFFVGVIGAGDRDIDIATREGVEHGLVSGGELSGADVPINAGDLAEGKDAHFEAGVGAADANVGGVLGRAQVTEDKADGGAIIVATDEGGGIAASGADDAGFAPEEGDVELAIAFEGGISIFDFDDGAGAHGWWQTGQTDADFSVLGYFIEIVFYRSDGDFMLAGVGRYGDCW